MDRKLNTHGEDIHRTASAKAEELKGYLSDIVRDVPDSLVQRDLQMCNSHINAALQYLRTAMEGTETFGEPAARNEEPSK